MASEERYVTSFVEVKSFLNFCNLVKLEFALQFSPRIHQIHPL